MDTVTYGYGDSSWGDLLTTYDGSAITYDVNGNPLDDGTWEYTWEHGRQLESMSDGTTTWSYTYDADGLRTGKTDGTTSYSYVYNGGQLSRMTVTTVTETADGQTSTQTHTVDLTYDASGNPQTMTYDGTTYYYTVNIQGDVTGIVDESGNVLVRYNYQAYGTTYYYGVPTNSVGTTLRQINPITYRGYVYDKETKLYYLQSRYYNRTSGRFINADAFTSTGQGLLGNNMFAYCLNCPVGAFDHTGASSRKYRQNAEMMYLIPACGAVPLCMTVPFIFDFLTVIYEVTTDAVQTINQWFTQTETTEQLVQKAHSKIKEQVTKKSTIRYWTATVYPDYVDLGRPLTFNQAVHEVQQGRSIFAVTAAEAKAVALAAGGRVGQNNKALTPEIDRGKENTPGFYFHYHTYNRSGGHVYFLFW